MVAGCEKKAMIGAVVCQEHRDTALGEQTDREILKMTQRLEAMAHYEAGEEQREAAQEFRRGVLRGDYATLFSTEMVQALTEEGKGYDLQPEIGMMRVAMLRLMLDEKDPSRLAHALAKLGGALGKAMERQGVWAKEAQNRRDVRKYLESLEGSSRLMAPPPIETRGRVMSVAPEDGAEGIEREDEEGTVIEAVGKAIEEVEPVDEVVAADEQKVGYPDYYVDVEDWKDSVWGKAAERARIARGR